MSRASPNPRTRFLLRRTLPVGFALGLLGVWLACGSDSGTGGTKDAGLESAVSADSTPTLDARADAGADVDGARPGASLAGLLDNEGVWRSVPVGSNCGLREATVIPDPFPKRTWASCGDGCSIAEAALPFDTLQGSSLTTAAGTFDDAQASALLLFAHRSTLAEVIRIERLSDGATVAAASMRLPTKCMLAFGGGAAVDTWAIFNQGRSLFARTPRSPGGAVSWQQSWSSQFPVPANERFSYDDGYGLSTYSELLMLSDTSITDPTSVGPGGSLVFGFGAQLVWGYGTDTIYSTSAATGKVSLVTLPAGRLVMGVRGSSSRIVWIDGQRSGDFFADAKWRASPRVASPGAVVVKDGPIVPIRGALADLKTQGDWAAADGPYGDPEPTDHRVFVWNMSTDQAFVLPHRPGNVFQRVLAVTPSELILAESGASDPAQLIKHIVRIDFAKLAVLVATWAK